MSLLTDTVYPARDTGRLLCGKDQERFLQGVRDGKQKNASGMNILHLYGRVTGLIANVIGCGCLRQSRCDSFTFSRLFVPVCAHIIHWLLVYFFKSRVVTSFK